MIAKILLPAVALAMVAPMPAIPTITDGASAEARDRYERRRDREYRDYRGRDERLGSRSAWRGKDGRYYCKRSNGTTGLVIGGLAGGVAGNAVAGRGDKTLGTVLGAAGGALLGREIDRSSARCR